MNVLAGMWKPGQSHCPEDHKFQEHRAEGSPLQGGPLRCFSAAESDKWRMEGKTEDSLWQRQLRIPLWAHVRIRRRRVVNILVGIRLLFG